METTTQKRRREWRITRQYPKDYHLTFQVISVVCCVLVVLLHVRVSYWVPTDEPRWWFENAISFIGMVAVPNFLMMSGANLIDYLDRYDTPTFLKKRWMRVGVPYLLWTTISLVWALLVGEYQVKGVADLFRPYYSNAVNSTYWYIRTTLALYVAIPVVAFAIKGMGHDLNRRRRMIDYMILSCLLMTFVFPLGRLYDPIFFETTTIPFGAGYLIYMLLGYRLTKFPVSRNMKIIINVFAVVGSLLFLFGTAYVSFQKGGFDAQFADYLTFPLLAMSIAFFVNMTSISWERLLTKKLQALFAYVSKLTIGIYMV